MAFGMKDSPPEGPAELRQQAVKCVNSLRVSNSHAFLPSDLHRMQKLGRPLSSKLISILSRIVNWASLIVIFAALAVSRGRPIVA